MKHIMFVAAVCLAAAVPLMSQELPDDPAAAAASRPAAPPESPEGVLPPAEPSGDAETRRLASVLEQLTPQELDDLVKRAMTLLREEERRMVAAEISNGLLYAEADVQKALADLSNAPADTQKDNVERICRAFAMVDARFGRAWTLLHQNRFPEAIDAARTLVSPQVSTYAGAARYFVYGQALVGAGKFEEAVDAYSEIWSRMKDRTSFAAEAMLRTAQAWEAQHRGYNALRMYSLYIKNYGMILPETERVALGEKVKALRDIYKDPLGSVANRMESVEKRLSATDSGKETQKTQQEIVALLDDLIRTAEEQSGGGGSGAGQGEGASKGKKPGEGEGSGSGQQAGSGSQTGKATGGSPAQTSTLRLGETVRTGATGEVYSSSESGDWSKLPPREREKLEQLRKKMLSERYQDIISDYHKRLAKPSN
jgi:TolA-binding protein